MADRSRGFNDAELFLNKPAEDCDSPTVEPLRIFKPQSPQPPSDKPAFSYPPPASSSKPSYPLPPGASSSADPLPYPEDIDFSKPQVPQPQASRPSVLYPDNSRRSSGSSGTASATTSKPSHHYPAPAPPPAKSYVSPKPPTTANFNDTSPRINTSPVEKRPGLAERRGAAPLPLSPVSPEKEKEESLFAKPLGDPKPTPAPMPAAAPAAGPSYQSYAKKTYYPPPGGASSPSTAASGAASTSSSNAPGRDSEQDTLKMPAEQGVNRFASTASTSTTRASRGSPPPPETPIVEPGGLPELPSLPGGGIEERYAAAGISGTATLNSFSAAATQRLAQYGGAPPSAHISRPWTPTETPDMQPHGPPTVYQGNDVLGNPPRTSAGAAAAAAAVAPLPNIPSFDAPPSSTPVNNQRPPSSGQQQQVTDSDGRVLQVSVLEQDFQRMGTKTPPPAYSSVTPSGGSGYPNEKGRPAAGSSSSAAPAATSAPAAASASIAAPVAVAAVAAASAGPSSRPLSFPAPPVPTGSAGPLPQKQQPPSIDPAAALASPGLPPAGHPALAGDHPAFANDPKAAEAQNGVAGTGMSHTPSVFQGGAGPSSPPPLPEGWIAHLDQTSGQYYFIHLATSSTQWDFPKGPNPIHHEAAPLSPTASTYGNPMASPMFGKQALASPMFTPVTPGYAESIMSVAAQSQAPSTAGFTGPPPTAGVDIFKINPTNGVYFGPYLRYTNMDVEKGIWMGSILIVTDAPQPPTIHLHLSMDLSPNPSQLVPNAICTHQRWNFYKYNLEIAMTEGTERWTYAVTSHLGCSRYEFVVAGKNEAGWRFVAHSGNDFATTTSQNDRGKLGGFGFMWKDVLQKNIECGGFHVQLGLGDQIYGDRLWKEVPLLKQWLATSGKDNRKNASWTARHEEDVSHAYFHYYTSHFDQPFLREAFAQIPHVLQMNDHDIFGGYGSFPDYMQTSQIFKNIGRIATEMYLLFQHHTTAEILRNVSSDRDLFTVTGTGWHFVKYLGPSVVVAGPDCRSERTQNHVMAGPTYQGIFPKVAMLPPSVQHCIWMLSVPLIYPRLETFEQVANSIATGKKAVNTTYNLLGKVTSSVAGVVGGKEVVQHGFSHVKKAVGKSGLMGNVLNQFGDIDLADALKDLWTHESKDLERTYLIRTLQGISQQKGLRMTFLSGDVGSCGAGLVHDPSHPSDHKTMYQIISAPIVAAPPGNYLMKMLHRTDGAEKPLYVPPNRQKTNGEVSDTKEDMIDVFHIDASGAAREHKRLMNRRNYVTGVVFDAAAAASPVGPGVNGGLGIQGAPSVVGAGGAAGGEDGMAKLSLAVDFVVQGDGALPTPTKYGPVIIEHLEWR